MIFQTNRISHMYNFKCEVAYTSLYIHYTHIYNTNKTNAPTINKCIEFSLNHLENKIEDIDWYKLSNMSKIVFNIPEFMPFNAHYQTTVSLTAEYDKKLTDFINIISIGFKENKKKSPYRAKAVALLFRAVMAEDLGILPYKNS